MSRGVVIKHIEAASDHIQATFLERLAEWIFAGIMFSVGLILARPEDTFGLSPGTVPLARLASETTWMLYCCTVGGVRLLALFINGWVVPHTYVLRIICSFLSVLAWVTISLGIMSSGAPSIGLAVWPWIFLAEMVCLYRTGRDYARWRDTEAALEP